MTMQLDEVNWNQAGCMSVDTELLYEDGDPHDVRKLLCGPCPIRAACLERALENEEQYGIWGGLTPRQRLIIHRAQNNNPNWRWSQACVTEEYMVKMCPQKQHPIEGSNVFVDHRGTKVCRTCYEETYKSRPPRPRSERRKEVA